MLKLASGPTCGECRHYDLRDVKSGACRRFPPTLIMAPVETLNGFDVRPVARVVEVPADWRCGEYAPRLSA